MGLVQPLRVKGPKHSGVARIVPLQSNTYWEADLAYVWAGRDGFAFAVLARFGGPVPKGQTLIVRVDRGP